MPLSPRSRPLFLARFLSYRFLSLLLALLILLVASPLMGNDVLDHAAVAVLLSILLFTTVIAASTARHIRWIAATLATGSGNLHRPRPRTSRHLSPGSRAIHGVSRLYHRRGPSPDGGYNGDRR